MDSAGMFFPSWENLHEHLLDLVLERLESITDYLTFSVVCKSWNHVAKINRNQSRHTAPMLLISSDKQDTWNLYNVMNDKVLGLQLRLPSKRFCGSSKGWLVVVQDNFVVTLMNPFSRVEGCKEKENSVIDLPPLRHHHTSEKLDHYVYKATISADPILNADDCIVTVIYGEFCCFAFIRLGKDTDWTYIDEGGFLFSDVVHVGDKVYVVNGGERILSFDTTSESETTCRNFKTIITGLKRPSSKTYLVHCDERGSFIVKRYVKWYGSRLHPKCVTYKFEIFEQNFDKHEWIEKETLGDAALFLGENSSIFVLASKLPGCQPNCIYFTSDYHRSYWRPGDFGVYNIKTKSISKPYTATAMTLLGRTKRPAIWVVPTMQEWCPLHNEGLPPTKEDKKETKKRRTS